MFHAFILNHCHHGVSSYEINHLRLSKVKQHNRRAPYWAILMILLVIIGVSTTWISLGGIWNGYVLDIAGPAWNYILFRNLSGTYRDNRWTRFFTPIRTLLIFVGVLYFIEFMQFLNVYESTYDPWDFVAYISLMAPIFIIDYYFTQHSEVY